jgi:hypothetical protein
MTAASWYPDPADPSRLRWWDGNAWTEHTAAVPAAQPVAAYSPSYAAQPSPARAGLYAAPAFDPSAGQQLGQAPGPVVRRADGRAFVPALAVAAGVAPDRCCRHGQAPVKTRKLTFQSPLPWWAYLTLFASLLVFIIVAVSVRKSVRTPAWPFCAICVQERRRRLAIMWGALALVYPGLLFAGWVGGLVSSEMGWVGTALLVLVGVGLPLLAAVLGILGSFARISDTKVTPDGLLVSVPGRAFPEPQARRPAHAMGF